MPNHDEWRQRAAALSPDGRAWIDGARVAASDGNTFASLNPMGERTVAEIGAGSAEDIDRAVACGRRVFEAGDWSRADPLARRDVMKAVATLLRNHAETLALLDTLEMGKRIGEALDDVEESALLFDWFGEVQDKGFDQLAASPAHTQASVSHEPLGVVGAVVPWNYPLHNACVKIVPALAAGNSVVLKPAEESSLSALLLGELCQRAGLPDGVLNVVPGLGHVAGEALGRHHDVDALGFTGSTEIGKRFQVYAGESNLKSVWLECGGKSPLLVFDDVEDLDAAVEAAASGIFTNAGQVCSAHSRLLLQQSVAEPFLARLRDRAEALVAGDPLDPATTLSPLVSRAQFNRVCSYLEAGREQATRFCGGEPLSAADGSLFVQPTVFTDVSRDSRLFQEEIFGPVLSVTTFRDTEDAVSLANDSRYGLAASLFTTNLSRAHRVADALRAGTVSVNTVDAVSPQTPFGGVKASGIGRDYALHGMRQYMAVKTRWIHY